MSHSSVAIHKNVIKETFYRFLSRCQQVLLLVLRLIKSLNETRMKLRADKRFNFPFSQRFCAYILIFFHLFSARNQPTETGTPDEVLCMQNHRSRELYLDADGAVAISLQADLSRCWCAAVPRTDANPSSLDTSADGEGKM